MLTLNPDAAAARAKQQAAAAQSTASSAQADVAALETASEYRPGDTLHFDQVAIPGFITTSTTQMCLMFPLDKALSGDVSTISVQGHLTVRGVQGYVEGTSGKDFSDFDVLVQPQESCLGVRLTKGSALDGAVNNTPFGAWIEDTVFTFS